MHTLMCYGISYTNEREYVFVDYVADAKNLPISKHTGYGGHQYGHHQSHTCIETSASGCIHYRQEQKWPPTFPWLGEDAYFMMLVYTVCMVCGDGCVLLYITMT